MYGLSVAGWHDVLVTEVVIDLERQRLAWNSVFGEGMPTVATSRDS